MNAHLVGDGTILFGLSLAGIPISVAIAVLRYRLYAIDHIISRTISWAVITAVLVAVFVGGVLGLQAALARVTQAPTLAVAASTLVGVRAVPAAPPARPARRRPAVRSRPHRCGADRTGLRRAPPARRSPSTRSPPTSGRPIDRSVRPSTQGLWLRGTLR